MGISKWDNEAVRVDIELQEENPYLFRGTKLEKSDIPKALEMLQLIDFDAC